MGLNYGQKRGRLEQLNVRDDTSLTGFALSEYISFEKHDIQDVARIVNAKLDTAERRLQNE